VRCTRRRRRPECADDHPACGVSAAARDRGLRRLAGDLPCSGTQRGREHPRPGHIAAPATRRARPRCFSRPMPGR
jgi:hypothetical protein